MFAPVDSPDDVPADVEVVVTGRSVALPANGSRAPVTVSVRAVERGVRALRAGAFDVVHVHEPFAPGLPYGLLLAGQMPPRVATFHRSGDSVLYRALRPLTVRLGSRLARCWAVSEAARATAGPAVGRSIELAFNGVEVDAFQGVEPWPGEDPAVLFLARHEARKGLEVLLEAFERMRRRRQPGAGRRPVLWVAGDGPETPALRRRHPEAADLRWLGVLSEEEKRRRLVAARVLCAPSLGGESFGMVLLEAMAARTAVVASDLPGYRQAAGGHAQLVAPGDEAALADALDQNLTPDTGPAGADRTGLEAAWAWAAHWSMARLAEWYEGRYRSLVSGPTG